jgi:hypothetical protein
MSYYFGLWPLRPSRWPGPTERTRHFASSLGRPEGNLIDPIFMTCWSYKEVITVRIIDGLGHSPKVGYDSRVHHLGGYTLC